LDGAAGAEEDDDELLESEVEDVLSPLFDSVFDSFESLFDVVPLSVPDCLPFCE
jgi:hypothetical protein